mgnify:CR=1 FL=1
MRLNILSLQTGSRELADVSIHDTVDGLKAKLSEERLVDAQPTGLRLIHSGKTLAVGSERLSDAGVAEGDVIVVVKRRGSGDENAWKQREMNKPSPDAATVAEAMSKASLGPEEGERGDEEKTSKGANPRMWCPSGPEALRILFTCVSFFLHPTR